MKTDKFRAELAAAKSKSFHSVFDALCDTGAEATMMKLRSMLAMELERHIKAQGWSKATAKKRLGARVAYLTDRPGTLTADDLAELLGEVGLELKIRAVKSTFGKTPSKRRPVKASKGA